MGEVLQALLLIFALLDNPADCARGTRRKQNACNTVSRCNNLQCCISTGIYPKYESNIIVVKYSHCCVSLNDTAVLFK